MELWELAYSQREICSFKGDCGLAEMSVYLKLLEELLLEQGHPYLSGVFLWDVPGESSSQVPPFLPLLFAELGEHV